MRAPERAGETWGFPLPWYRRLDLGRHLPLLLALAALALALYSVLTRGEPGAHRPTGSSVLTPASLPSIPRLAILLLAGVGARVVFRGLVKAVVALVILVLLVHHWPTVVAVLDGAFAPLGLL